MEGSSSWHVLSHKIGLSLTELGKTTIIMSVYSVVSKYLKLDPQEYTSGFFGYVTSSGLVDKYRNFGRTCHHNPQILRKRDSTFLSFCARLYLKTWYLTRQPPNLSHTFFKTYLVICHVVMN